MFARRESASSAHHDPAWFYWNQQIECQISMQWSLALRHASVDRESFVQERLAQFSHIVNLIHDDPLLALREWRLFFHDIPEYQQLLSVSDDLPLQELKNVMIRWAQGFSAAIHLSLHQLEEIDGQMPVLQKRLSDYLCSYSALVTHNRTLLMILKDASVRNLYDIIIHPRIRDVLDLKDILEALIILQEKTSFSHRQLDQLNQIIQQFKSKPTIELHYQRSGQPMIYINGGGLVYSLIKQWIAANISTHHGVWIAAEKTIHLDESFVFPGKNIILNAPLIQVHGTCQIDVSGRAADLLPLAPIGEKEGLHGKPGESGGNVCILTNSFVNGKQLTLTSHGGAGGDGGDGKHGLPGKSGKDGVKRSAIPGGGWYCVHYANVAKGTRGALGSKGENGGGAGLGGHGGYAGDLQIVCLDETPDLPSRLFKEGLVGKQGKPGEGGEGGKPGKDGIDEAVWREGMLSKQKHGLGEYEFIDMEWGLFGSGATIPKRLRTLDDFERYQGTLQTESQRTLHGTRGGISTLPREEATRQAPISTQAVAAHLLDLLKSESFLLGFKQQIVMSRLATIARSPDAPPHLSNLERLRKQLSTVQEKIQNTEAHLHQLKTQLLRETHAIAPKPARDLFFTFDKILSITPKKTSDYVPLAYLRKDK